jgi:oligoendopeptidase F
MKLLTTLFLAHFGAACRKAVQSIVLCSACVLFCGSASAQAPAGEEQWQWNLQDLFPDLASWDAERQRLLTEFEKFDDYRGTLGNSSADLYAALRFTSDTYRAALRVYVYASLQQDEDLRDTAAQERNQLAEAMYARFSQETAWMDPELIAAGQDRIRAFMAENAELAPFRHQLDNTLRQAAHTLGAETEQALSFFTQPFDAPSAIYSLIANSDIPFPLITTPEGEEVRLDSQGYGRLRSHPDAAFRKQVFDAFWGRWQDYRNSVGMVLNSHIQTQVALAKARHFDSVLQRELFSDNLPEAVYRTLVSEVNAALPTLHRYFRLRARMLGLEQLRYSDIYPPLVSLDKRFDIETSRDITLDAMAMLGEDWVAMQAAALDDRWMHVFPQQGKRSGAYMQGSAYDVHPYLLLNHNDDFDSLSTFAHEWGHAMHTLYARQSQPFETADYATFTAEIPSTSLELILQQYMTRNAETDDERLFYLGYSLENLRGTFFRQTMFAEFELLLYEAVERGEALSGSRISELYLEILRRYHGHDEGVVEIDELYGNEWMFVPHFYYNMYVFQYATSLTAGTALYTRMVEDTEAGVINYKNLLRAGGSDYPYTLLREAGVDLATAAPYQSVIARMNAVMDEIEALLDMHAVPE